MLRARTLADPDDPLCGIFVKTDDPPQAKKLQSNARIQIENQEAEGHDEGRGAPATFGRPPIDEGWQEVRVPVVRYRLSALEPCRSTAV